VTHRPLQGATTLQGLSGCIPWLYSPARSHIAKRTTAIPQAHIIHIHDAEDYYSMALKSDGSVWAWGDNDDGQLGDGSTADRLTPVRTLGLTETSVATARGHSLARTSSGRVWAWGENDNGQLGDDTSTDRTTPIM